ncbi:MAG TPA: hypothetical protein VFL86_15080 [Burkholderiaceae bacterium]|nr:hypothetical protein [Burkholderiaceae bacterium]
MKPTSIPTFPTNPADAGLPRIVLSPVPARSHTESPLSINALVPQSHEGRLPTFGMLHPVLERQPPLAESSIPVWSANRLEGPDSDHKLVKAFAAEAASRHMCSDKTLSHHVTGLNSLARWLAEPAQKERFSSGLRGLLQQVSLGRAEVAVVSAVLREFRHGGASADVRRRINYAFNALCKVTGAGAVVSESSFLDVSMEDAAVIRRFRRAAQSTPGNNPKTLANLAVTLKHLSKWLAQRGEMDLEGLQHNPDESVADSVILGFRRDPAVQGAAKSRVGAAVKLLRESAGGSVVLPKRPRRASYAQPAAGAPEAGQDA